MPQITVSPDFINVSSSKLHGKSEHHVRQTKSTRPTNRWALTYWHTLGRSEKIVNTSSKQQVSCRIRKIVWIPRKYSSLTRSTGWERYCSFLTWSRSIDVLVTFSLPYAVRPFWTHSCFLVFSTDFLALKHCTWFRSWNFFTEMSSIHTYGLSERGESSEQDSQVYWGLTDILVYTREVEWVVLANIACLLWINQVAQHWRLNPDKRDLFVSIAILIY